MIFAKQIEKMYRKMMFVRYDENDVTFYFSASDFEGLQQTPYSFKTKQGNTLQGYFYHYGSPEQGRIVVFDHGMGGGHRAYMKEIELLARHGFLVFSYDHTGCMESEGASVNGFSQSICDLDCCLSALKSDEKYSGMRLSVIGHSWGALACQNIAAFHPDVAHIVAMSGPVSVRHMLDQFFGGILGLYRKHIYELEKSTNPEYAVCDASQSLKNTDAEVLIIYSADDKTVSKERHFDVLKNALSEKKNVHFLLLDGKNHNPNYTADAVKYLGEYIASRTEKTKKGELADKDSAKRFVDSFDWDRMTEQDESVWDEIFKTLDK